MDSTLGQLLNELISVTAQFQQALARIKELETELASRPAAESKDLIDKPSAGPLQPQAENGSVPSNKPAWAP